MMRHGNNAMTKYWRTRPLLKLLPDFAGVAVSPVVGVMRRFRAISRVAESVRIAPHPPPTPISIERANGIRFARDLRAQWRQRPAGEWICYKGIRSWKGKARPIMA